MSERRPWQGVLAIARFNWPFYVAAMAVLLALYALTALGHPGHTAYPSTAPDKP